MCGMSNGFSGELYWYWSICWYLIDGSEFSAVANISYCTLLIFWSLDGDQTTYIGLYQIICKI